MAEPRTMDRRRFVAGAGIALAASPGLRAAAAPPTAMRFDLTVARVPVAVTGRRRWAVGVNGTAPGPVLRLRQGDLAEITVRNTLREPTSIHWHGLRLPAEMDGVPGLSFAGVPPGGSFTYRFPVVQSGAYWWHSHSGMQEQLGMHGALVIAPAGAEPHPAEREHVLLLSDWTDADPMAVMANLKAEGDYYNRGRRTVGDLVSDVRRSGLRAALKDRAMWGDMRMTPTDILDVSGAAYTYLVNGQPPAAN